MGEKALEGIISVATAVVAVAIVAVLVSKNSQTGTVLTAGGKALSSAITAAVSPVTGAQTAGATQIGQAGLASPLNWNNPISTIEND